MTLDQQLVLLELADAQTTWRPWTRHVGGLTLRQVQGKIWQLTQAEFMRLKADGYIFQCSIDHLDDPAKALVADRYRWYLSDKGMAEVKAIHLRAGRI